MEKAGEYGDYVSVERYFSSPFTLVQLHQGLNGCEPVDVDILKKLSYIGEGFTVSVKY